LLAILFILAIFKPFGNLDHAATVASYNHNALANGFLQGYNTMDVLAGLVFGVSVVSLIESFGIKDSDDVAKTTIKGSIIAMIAMAVIYAGLIILGAMSLSKFKLVEGDNGQIALTNIVNTVFGNAGTYVLGTLAVLALFTTATGLLVAFARDFSKIFPRVSYKTWLVITALVSFGVANFGLSNIISWSIPFLYLLYPIALSVIFVALTTKIHGGAGLVYKLTVVGAVVFAIFDALSVAPFAKSVSRLTSWYSVNIPLASINLAWIIPTAVFWLISVLIVKMRK
jgi:LIVCS family branched-chain amino acid:cation transporter